MGGRCSFPRISTTLGQQTAYCKITKCRTPDCCSVLKFEQCLIQDADGMAKSVDPDQTAPSGVVGFRSCHFRSSLIALKSYLGS